MLADLANVLETSIDNILMGGKRIIKFQRKITVQQMREGMECFVRLGELLGKDNLFYIGAIEGVDHRMNIEMEKYLTDSYTKEAMIAEAAVQCIHNGAYIDLSDIQKGFEYAHWAELVLEYAKNHGIK